MASAQRKQSTGTLLHKTPSNFPSRVLEAFFHKANQILTRAWKTKQLPPIIKAFTWRIIRRALSTAERAARFSNHIDDHCATCGAMEDDAHLFFQCQLPRVV
jgi:hypothetical protein